MLLLNGLKHDEQGMKCEEWVNTTAKFKRGLGENGWDARNEMQGVGKDS